MDYLHNHWQGNHSLARAFWINSLPFCVAFNLLFEQISLFNNPSTIITYARLYLLIMIVTYIVILPWQIVGITRSLVRYIKNKKQLIASLLVIIFLLYELTVLSFILFNSPQKLLDGVYISFSSYEKGGYEISLDESYENAILVKGKFNRGISNELEKVLEDNPQIITITFDSPGGLEFEARNVFSIIKEKGLNTYVSEYCVSACVSAFIGGEKRQISSEALLGFHQGSPELGLREFTKDELSDKLYDAIKFYKQQGIDKKFVMRFFRTPPDALWYPKINELLKSGVITEVLNK